MLLHALDTKYGIQLPVIYCWQSFLCENEMNLSDEMPVIVPNLSSVNLHTLQVLPQF